MINPQAFTEVVNGRQATSDGILIHRGTFAVRDTTQAANLFQVGGSTDFALLNQQLLVGRPAARVSVAGATSWSDAHVRIEQLAPSEPRLGFHEAGNSALALYKPSGSHNQLRIKGNDGSDYALAGAVGSGQARVGQWFAGSAYAAPQANVYGETDVRVNFTSTGAETRFEWSASLLGLPSPNATYVGLGLDGALTWNNLACWTSPGAGWANAVSGVVYASPGTITPGAHRVSLWVYASAIGQVFNAGAMCALWVTEQRI
jgi:hypothetical protein